MIETAKVDEAIAELQPLALNRMNADFEDSVLLVGRILGGWPDATAASITAIDRLGVDIVVTDADGDHSGRIDFASPITSPVQLSAELMGLVARARIESGEAGMTTAERELAESTRIRTFLTTVSAVEDVHPHLRRITLTGDDLATFEPAGPDTFLYVLLPPPGRNALTIDQGFTWEQYGRMPEAERPVGAYYTLRRWDRATREITLLFVLHGDTGPASAWAMRAQPGDAVAVWGPRTAYHPPAGTDWYLLVADETGLPAVAVILETLPEGTPVRVFAEVADASERHAVRVGPNVDVTWLHRDGAPAGTTTLLADAVRALDWPGGTPYVWGGGESRTMTAVRKYVRGEVGLPREAVSLVAYWRHNDSPPDD